jgi:hypothetical protein
MPGTDRPRRLHSGPLKEEVVSKNENKSSKSIAMGEDTVI